MHVLAVDQSTASTKGVIFDQRGAVVARAARPHRQHHPRTGWAEHDAEEIYRNLLAVIGELVRGAVDAGSLASLAITNQRETAVVWDRCSGRPVHPAIVWQCMRGAEACRELRARGLEDLFRQRTGLILDPFFSASKIGWVLEHVPGARRKAESGRLLAGTIDSWLVWKLTGGSVHVTDFSNASRTLLLDLRQRRWDPELCAHFGIPLEMLPELVSSSGAPRRDDRGRRIAGAGTDRRYRRRLARRALWPALLLARRGEGDRGHRLLDHDERGPAGP